MTASPRRLRVLLLARYGTNGASSRVRHYASLPSLADHGITVEVDGLIGNDSLVRLYAGQARRWDQIGFAYARRITLIPRLSRYDVLWIEKEALPGLPWPLERLFLGQLPTVVDFDDLWIERKTGPSRDTAKLHKVLRSATCVTVANDALAETFERKCGRRPRVLPSAIDVATYYQARTERSHSPLVRPITLGWIGTPLTAARYLPSLASILNQLAADGLATTTLIGADAAVPALSAKRLPWAQHSEATDVANFDIGIMPLDQTLFSAHKSGWKLLQCMASGCPVVATRTPFNSSLIDEGVTGYLVDTIDEFDQRLRHLIKNPEQRLAMGQAAHTAVQNRFDRPEHTRALATLLRDASTLPVRVKAALVTN
jgi:glycosyltransferase involved in cell wall biosynthesis